jgi:hypothetical protein
MFVWHVGCCSYYETKTVIGSASCGIAMRTHLRIGSVFAYLLRACLHTCLHPVHPQV